MLEMKGITKRFPGITANSGVDFTLRHGEVHAILGENGAGKSTLMSILAGLYYPDEGEIIVDGDSVRFNSPGDAIAKGIGMVYQHFMLVENHSVAENIILGDRSMGFMLNRTAIEKRLRDLSRKYQLRIEPWTPLWQLSVGEQQRVELLKAFYREASILILDEPTAVLTPQETRDLFATLKLFVQSGNSVIFISHKLDEIMDIAHRITVLKSGRVAGTLQRAEATRESLAAMMVGHQVQFSMDRKALPAGEEALVIKSLSAENDRGLPALKSLELTLRRGEIMGIAGVAGNGQKELAETLTGLRKARSGSIMLFGEELTGLSSREITEKGMAFIPEDRLGMGLVPNLGIDDNMILKRYYKPPFSHGPLLDGRAISDFSREKVKEFSITGVRDREPVKAMSGGNLQKIILARELASSPKVLIAVYPTRGLDIGAVEFVHQKLAEEKERGTAVLMISEDLDELFTVADRMAVIYEGHIMGVLNADEATMDEIGLMMSGVHPEHHRQEPPPSLNVGEEGGSDADKA